MIYGSVCSGIEAATAAWHPLGWSPAFFSEIEKFPSAVLAHHYPDVVNYGDLTKFDEWPDVDIDVLVGGTPCQDLSVAGKRAGLAGERSGLFRDFVACADRYKPRYIVWENVPGSLSTNGGKDIQEVLDSFTQIGYACDIDIHDAQHFGLAQRRRRVFIVCVRLDDFLSKRTPISERIAGELLLQPLVDTWVAILQAWSPDKSLSGYEFPTEQSASSAMRRIELLEKALGSSACTRLLNALGASPAPVTGEQKPSASTSRQPEEKQTGETKMGIGGYPLWSTVGVSGSKSTDTSWKSILDALSAQKSGSTTSISIAQTIESKISTFAAQSLHIADCIIGSKSCSDQPKWSSDYWNLASLLLTMLEAITSYARQSSEDMFAEPALRDDWWDYIEQARILAYQSQRNSGNEPSPETFLSLPESMRRDTAPRREARQGVAPTISARPTGGGGLGTDFDLDGGLIAADCAPTLDAHFGDKMGLENQHINQGGGCSLPPVAKSLNAHGARLDSETETLLPMTGGGFDVAHALRGEGFDASEDGTGRGTPIVPVAYRTAGDGAVYEEGDKTAPLTTATDKNANIIAIQERAVSENMDAGPGGAGFRTDGAAYTLEARTVPQAVAFNAKAGGSPTIGKSYLDDGTSYTLDCDGLSTAVAFAQNTRDEVRLINGDGQIVGALAAEPGMKQQAYVAEQWAVRRLTPRECEHLQGFPDGYTRISWRGKDASDCPDGPRYKALGNSMAVNVMRWIGRRIEMVEELTDKAECLQCRDAAE